MEFFVNDFTPFEEGVREDVSSSLYGFDPEKDLSPVDPYGFINLAEAYENGSVPTTIADEVANYNGIDDPESIIGTPRDIFEAYRMNANIRSIDKRVSSSNEDKTS